MRDYFGKNNTVRFLFPIDGDCVNVYDGKEISGGVRIPVSIEAPEGHKIEVNGVPARFENGAFRTYADILNKNIETLKQNLTEQGVKIAEISVKVQETNNSEFLADNKNFENNNFENLKENLSQKHSNITFYTRRSCSGKRFCVRTNRK